MGDNGVLLGREHLLAAEFTGEEGRYQISGLNIKADGTAEATNGNYAIRVPPCPMPAEDFPEVAGRGGAVNGAGVLIPAAVCKETIKALPKSSTIPILGCAHIGAGATEGTATITTTDLETSNPRTVKVQGGKFPDLDVVIPTDDADRLVIGLNARYLKQIADYAIKVAGKSEPIVSLSIGKPESVMRWDVTIADGRKAVIALMPCRITRSQC